ncbi:MAG: CotH kinase family protein, partial [Muribaculaceae bacterium]|nr:CotH kinase family protein [Muribaculaceae bacterium]
GGGCKFVNWTINGEVVSTANPYEVAITEDVDIVANFTDAYSKLTNVPTIYINTESGVEVTSKEDYVTAYVTVRGAKNDEDNITEVLTEIKGRGNSTWGMAKKPYRLKFDEKIKFLGNEAKEKNWVLLANYADKTLMRNALAFETARNIFDFGFTPSVTFVDVVLNGENIGSYMLTDQVEVKPKRVPVTEQDETTTSSDPEITGGYLIEVDGFADSEISWFQTTKGMKVTIKYPKDDEINSDQSYYIKNYTQQMENALFGTNYTDAETGWRKYIDEASMVDWYIACELFGNSDAWWSTYMYKERDDVFKFGPLWDFDIAFNNDDRLGDATNKLMRTYAHDPKTWIARWWQDAGFQAKVKVRWEELRKAGVAAFMTNYIDNTADYLQTSQQNNFQVWNILNTKVYRELATRGSYAAEVEFLKNYVTSRVGFLDDEFGLSQLIFSVSAIPSDEEKGMAEISASEVEEGGSVTLTATAKPGYRFLNWTLKGKTVSTKSSCTVPVTANSEFVANFVEFGATVQGAALEGKAFGIPADQLGFNNQTPFTLAFWIYFNEFNHDYLGTQFINIRSPQDGYPASDWGYLWSVIANEGDTNDQGDVAEEGNWLFDYRLMASYGASVATPTYVKFEPQKWYHVAMACGYTSNRTFELFVNGKKIGSSTAPQSLYSWKSSNVIMVGGLAYGRAPIDGTIDEVRLYKKVLSEDEVKAAMEHIDTVTDETLIGYWDFESAPDDDNKLLSGGANKDLVACLYDVQIISEGSNKYISIPFVFTEGYVDNLYDLYVTVASANTAKGTVEVSSNSVEKGSSVTLMATPKDGYEFVNWTVNGEVVSTESIYQPTITEHTNFVAVFEVVSGIDSANNAEQIKVAVLGDEIKLYGTTQGEPIAVYSANGMLISNGVSEGEITTISTSVKGVLIIKIGEQVFKVVK